MVCYRAIQPSVLWDRYPLTEGNGTALVNTSAATGESVHSLESELSVKPAGKWEGRFSNTFLNFMACVAWRFQC